MTETLFHAPDEFRKTAWIKTMDEYQAMYTQSIEDPDTFWAGMADTFYWEKKWDKVREYNYHLSKGPISIKWFIK